MLTSVLPLNQRAYELLYKIWLFLAVFKLTRVNLRLHVYICVFKLACHQHYGLGLGRLNSVREWAKQSTGKVKSIVNWIRTGGNNKETIDRIEKRLRDYYRHKAHTKTKKKMKRRDDTVYSTMR